MISRAGKQYHLYTDRMSYVIEAAEKQVYSLYFGGRIDTEDLGLLSLPDGMWSSIDGSVKDERTEYDLWDSTRFTIPCLKSASQKSRMMKMSYKGANTDKTPEYEELTLYYRSDAGLDLDLIYRLYGDGVLARMSVIHALTDIRFESTLSGAFCLPADTEAVQRDISGRWAGEWQVRDHAVTEGVFTVESRRGITGTASNPAIMLYEPGATEERGRVWSCLLSYSGNWVIRTQKTALGTTRVVAGIHDFDYLIHLTAGETWQSPVLYLQYTADGIGQCSRTWHAFLREHVCRKRPARPVLYNSWEATYFDVKCDEQMALADRAARLGCERFVVDDGWFGERNSDKAGLGDWQLNKEKFPDGLGKLIHHVNELGMDFGIWIEPEAVNPDSRLYRAHPDWVYHTDTQVPITMRNQYELNMSLPPVQEYLKKCIRDLLSTYDIRFIKWDMNRALTDLDSPFCDEPRTLWQSHVYGVYSLWRMIRDEFPEVELETCAGGGNRVDAGSLSLTDEFWTSDNTDPYDRLKIQYGVSQFYPMGKAMCWVTETADGKSPSRNPLRFRFHSAMCGGLGIGTDIRGYSEEMMEEAAGYIAEYKKVRDIIADGDLWRLGNPAEENRTAVEYISPDRGRVLVFAFLHSQNFFSGSGAIRLQGLDPGAVYCDAEGKCCRGSYLMEIGLPVTLEGDFDSRMILLTRQ